MGESLLIPKTEPNVTSEPRTSAELQIKQHSDIEAQASEIAENLAQLQVNAPDFNPAKSEAPKPFHSQPHYDQVLYSDPREAYRTEESNTHGFPTIHELPKLDGRPWLANPKTGAQGNFFQDKGGLWWMTFETCNGPKKVQLKFRDDLRIQFGRDIVSGIQGNGTDMVIQWNGDNNRYCFRWTRTAGDIRAAQPPAGNSYAPQRAFIPHEHQYQGNIPHEHQYQGNIGVPRSFMDNHGRQFDPHCATFYPQESYNVQPPRPNALSYHDNGHRHRQENPGMWQQIAQQEQAYNSARIGPRKYKKKNRKSTGKKPVRLADLKPEQFYAKLYGNAKPRMFMSPSTGKLQMSG